LGWQVLQLGEKKKWRCKSYKGKTCAQVVWHFIIHQIMGRILNFSTSPLTSSQIWLNPLVHDCQFVWAPYHVFELRDGGYCFNNLGECYSWNQKISQIVEVLNSLGYQSWQHHSRVNLHLIQKWNDLKHWKSLIMEQTMQSMTTINLQIPYGP
jgi:hypothetical protein